MRKILVVIAIAITMPTTEAADVPWRFDSKEVKAKGPYSFTKSISSGVVVVTPEVVTIPSFRQPTIQRNSSHQCANCGASQYRISGVGPVPGTHTHTCSRCRTTWYH